MAAVETNGGAAAAAMGGEEAHGDIRRRDFINIAAVSFAGIGSAALLYPLVNQMNPSADVLALASIEVDISGLPKARRSDDLAQAADLHPPSDPGRDRRRQRGGRRSLRDPQTLAERTKEGKPQWLITLGVCTHLGCVPLGASQGESRGEYGGYFCPCHGSHYDTAARVRKGPAPLNLAVPEYEFLSDTSVRIG